MIKIKENINTENRADLERFYNKLKKLDPGAYSVFVTDVKRQRSIEQNAYWWAVVVPILAAELGNNKEEMHTILCYKFLPVMVTVDGEEVRAYGTTSGLTVKQFGELIEEVQQWAIQEMNIYIPNPGEIPEEVLINNL